MTNREHLAKELLVDICSCPIARRHVENQNLVGDCSTVVHAQSFNDWASFQIPEPWSGEILKAPILFLSSNPGISANEAYPSGSWNDAQLWDYFNARFEGYWARGDNRTRNADGTYSAKSVNYWTNIRERTSELLLRPARMGVDFALSELVHCKSMNEVGVPSALPTCVDRYLTRLLALSDAVLLVLVGKKVLGHWNLLQQSRLLPSVPVREGTALIEMSGRKRFVVYLPHPSGPEPKRFCDWISVSKADEIRSHLPRTI